MSYLSRARTHDLHKMTKANGHNADHQATPDAVMYDDSSGRSGEEAPPESLMLLKELQLPEDNQGPLVDETDALPARMLATKFDIAVSFVSLGTYVFDLVMDILVARFFYLQIMKDANTEANYWYFGLTLTFILLPSLTMTGFSLRYYFNCCKKLVLFSLLPIS